MHEVTHISYGHGRVDIVMDSDSQTSVAAPGFRFGDYAALVNSCFSERELDRIGEGELAQITFYFVVSDEIDETEFAQLYGDAKAENEKTYGTLHNGLLVDLTASKAISNDSPVLFTTTEEDVELQMDIPLFLVKDQRYYYFLTDESGDYTFMDDASPDADVLTVKTHLFTPGILLYQDPGESLVPRTDNSFKLEMRHLLFAGVVVLVFFWFFIDHFHKKGQ